MVKLSEIKHYQLSDQTRARLPNALDGIQPTLLSNDVPHNLTPSLSQDIKPNIVPVDLNDNTNQPIILNDYLNGIGNSSNRKSATQSWGSITDTGTGGSICNSSGGLRYPLRAKKPRGQTRGADRGRRGFSSIKGGVSSRCKFDASNVIEILDSEVPLILYILANGTNGTTHENRETQNSADLVDTATYSNTDNL